MNKTLKISFSLKNTYRVNGILFSLKQISLPEAAASGNAVSSKGTESFCEHSVRTVGNCICISRQVPLLCHDGMRRRYSL